MVANEEHAARLATLQQRGSKKEVSLEIYGNMNKLRSSPFSKPNFTEAEPESQSSRAFESNGPKKYTYSQKCDAAMSVILYITELQLIWKMLTVHKSAVVHMQWCSDGYKLFS